MKEVIKDESLVAYCGLYCGACKRYLMGKCPGCAKNEKAAWCKVRSCCKENKYNSCGDCQTYQNPMECKKFNNFFSKLFGLIFGSDRQACIQRIKEVGTDVYASEMTEQKIHSIKRK